MPFGRARNMGRGMNSSTMSGGIAFLSRLQDRFGLSYGARRRSLLMGTALAGLALLATPAAAQQWTGATSSDYTVGSNWTGGTAPNDPAASVIFGSGASTTTVNLNTPLAQYSAGPITFNDPASAYTVSVSNTAYLQVYGDVNNTSGVTQNFSVTGDSGSGAGSFINFHGADAGSNVVYTVNAYGGVTFYSGGSASGANATFVLNGGSVSLSGDGTLELGSVEGSGILSYYGNPGGSSGNFQIGGLNTSTTLAAQIQEQTGTLSITKVGTGTLTLTGPSSYTGGTNLYGGALSLGNNAALGTGPLSASNGTTIDIQDGITISNDLTIDLSENINVGSGATGTYSGQISEFSDPSVIVKTGAGTLVLTNDNNSFSSGARIEDGTIQVTADHALGSGPITLDSGTLQAGANLNLANVSILFGAAGGTIDTNGFDISTTASMGDNDTPTGTFTKTGAGTLTIDGFAGNNTYATATDVAQGTLAAAATNIFSGNSAYTVESGATLSLGNFSQVIGSLAGAGTVDTGSGTLTTGGKNTDTTFSGSIIGLGGLTKTEAEPSSFPATAVFRAPLRCRQAR